MIPCVLRRCEQETTEATETTLPPASLTHALEFNKGLCSHLAFGRHRLANEVACPFTCASLMQRWARLKPAFSLRYDRHLRSEKVTNSVVSGACYFSPRSVSSARAGPPWCRWSQFMASLIRVPTYQRDTWRTRLWRWKDRQSWRNPLSGIR